MELIQALRGLGLKQAKQQRPTDHETMSMLPPRAPPPQSLLPPPGGTKLRKKKKKESVRKSSRRSSSLSDSQRADSRMFCDSPSSVRSGSLFGFRRRRRRDSSWSSSDGSSVVSRDEDADILVSDLKRDIGTFAQSIPRYSLKETRCPLMDGARRPQVGPPGVRLSTRRGPTAHFFTRELFLDPDQGQSNNKRVALCRDKVGTSQVRIRSSLGDDAEFVLVDGSTLC